MRLNISSAKWRPFCPGEDELSYPILLDLRIIDIAAELVLYSFLRYSSGLIKLQAAKVPESL